MDIVDVSLPQKKVYGKIITENFFILLRYTGIQVQDAKNQKRVDLGVCDDGSEKGAACSGV